MRRLLCLVVLATSGVWAGGPARADPSQPLVPVLTEAHEIDPGTLDVTPATGALQTLRSADTVVVMPDGGDVGAVYAQTTSGSTRIGVSDVNSYGASVVLQGDQVTYNKSGLSGTWSWRDLTTGDSGSFTSADGFPLVGSTGDGLVTARQAGWVWTSREGREATLPAACNDLYYFTTDGHGWVRCGQTLVQPSTGSETTLAAGAPTSGVLMTPGRLVWFEVTDDIVQQVSQDRSTGRITRTSTGVALEASSPTQATPIQATDTAVEWSDGYYSPLKVHVTGADGATATITTATGAVTGTFPAGSSFAVTTGAPGHLVTGFVDAGASALHPVQPLPTHVRPTRLLDLDDSTLLLDDATDPTDQVVRLDLASGSRTPLADPGGSPLREGTLDGDRTTGWTFSYTDYLEHLVVADASGVVTYDRTTTLARQAVTDLDGDHLLIGTAGFITGPPYEPPLTSTLVDLSDLSEQPSAADRIVAGTALTFAPGTTDDQGRVVTQGLDLSDPDEPSSPAKRVQVRLRNDIGAICQRFCYRLLEASPVGREIFVQSTSGENTPPETAALIDPDTGTVRELPTVSGKTGIYPGAHVTLTAAGHHVLVWPAGLGVGAWDLDQPDSHAVMVLDHGTLGPVSQHGLLSWTDADGHTWTGQLDLGDGPGTPVPLSEFVSNGDALDPSPTPTPPPTASAPPSPTLTPTASPTPAPPQRALVALHIGLRKRGASISGTVAGPPTRQRLVITDRHGRNRNVALLSPDAGGHVLWVGRLRPGDHAPHLAPLTH